MKKIAKLAAFAALNFTALNLGASPLETLLQGSKFSGEIGAYSETRRVISGTKRRILTTLRGWWAQRR